MGRARYLTEQEVLELWQAEHKKLSARLRAQFLGHPSLVPLTRLPAGFVRQAVSVSPKLVEILRETRRLFEIDLQRRADLAKVREERARVWAAEYPTPDPNDLNSSLVKLWRLKRESD
jgi:hypothetical protein